MENVRIEAAPYCLRALFRCDWKLGSQLEFKAFTAAWKVNTRSILFLFLFISVCVGFLFCYSQEEVKAFKNSSEKQKSLMSSSPDAEFCFLSLIKSVCPMR